MNLDNGNVRVNQKGSVASAAMVLLLTIASFMFIALLTDVVHAEDFVKMFGLSDSQASAVNLVFSRMRELTNGTAAIFTKIFGLHNSN